MKKKTSDPTEGLESIAHLAKYPTVHFMVELESVKHLKRISFQTDKPMMADNIAARVQADLVAGLALGHKEFEPRYWPVGVKWAARIADFLLPRYLPTWKSRREETTVTLYRELRPGCNRAVWKRPATDWTWVRVEA